MFVWELTSFCRNSSTENSLDQSEESGNEGKFQQRVDGVVTSGRKWRRSRCNERAYGEQMMDVEASYSDFINCDRTGRRNAVPDITGDAVAVGAGELTKDMAQMDLKAAEGDASGPPAPKAEASGSQDNQGKEGPS